MRKLKQFAAAVLMTFMVNLTAFGGQWMADETGLWYQNDDGSYPSGSWQWIDADNDGIAECYYFDENGYCLINTITPDGNIVNASGALVIDGVVQTRLTTQPDQILANETVVQNQETVSTQSQEANISNTQVQEQQSGYRVGETVWLSATGTKYHRIPNCGRMNPSKARQISVSDAVAQGYEACKKCY